MWWKNRKENNEKSADQEAAWEKRPMTREEIEKNLEEMTEEAPGLARKIFEASGQEPKDYTPLIRECMAAMIFGMLGAMSMVRLGYHEGRWTIGEMTILSMVFFGMSPDESAGLSGYLFSNSSTKRNPDFNVNINTLIHYGIELYFLLDQPKRLAEAVQTILQACYKDFGTGEGN